MQCEIINLPWASDIEPREALGSPGPQQLGGETLNQTIGIEFSAIGQDSVIRAVNELKIALEGLSGASANVKQATDSANGFQAAATNADKFASACSKVAATASGLGAVATNIDKITASMGRLASASARLQALPSGGIPLALPPGAQASSGPVPLITAGKNTQSGYTNPAQPHWSTNTPQLIMGATGPKTGGNAPQPPPIQPGTIAMNQVSPGKWEVPIPVGAVGSGGNGGGNRPQAKVSPDSPSPKGRNNYIPGGTNGLSWGKIGGAYLGYSVASKAMGAISDTNKNIFLGANRDEINVANQGLASVGMTSADRAITEASMNNYLAKYPYQTMPQALDTVGEVRSAYGVKDISNKTANEVAQTAMGLGVTAKMKPGESANLITNRLKAEESWMTPQERAQKVNPDSPWLANRSKQVAGTLDWAIEKYKLWGGGIAEFDKNALAMNQQLGWDAPKSYAFLGALKNQGMRESSVGVSVKSIAAEEGRAIARMELLNQRDAQGNLKYTPQQVTSAKMKPYVFEIMERNAQQQKADEWHLAEQLMIQKQMAARNYSDPFDIVGVSKFHRSKYEAQVAPGFTDTWKTDTAEGRKAEQAGQGRIYEKLDNNRKDLISPWKELEAAITRAGQATSKLHSGLTGLESVMGLLNQHTKAMGDASVKKESIEALEKDFKRGVPLGNKRAEFMKRTGRALQQAKNNGMDPQQLHNLEVSLRPEIWERQDRQEYSQAPGGIAWDNLGSIKTLSERYKMNPLIGDKPIMERRPDTPYESDEDRWKRELQARIGENNDSYPGGDGSGGAGGQIQEGAMNFSSAVDKFANVVDQINTAPKPQPVAREVSGLSKIGNGQVMTE